MDLFSQIIKEKNESKTYTLNKTINSQKNNGLPIIEDFKPFGDPPANYWTLSEWNHLNMIEINQEIWKDIQTLKKIGQTAWEQKTKGL